MQIRLAFEVKQAETRIGPSEKACRIEEVLRRSLSTPKCCSERLIFRVALTLGKDNIKSRCILVSVHFKLFSHCISRITQKVTAHHIDSNPFTGLVGR